MMSSPMTAARCHSCTRGARRNHPAHRTFDTSSIPTTANRGRSGTSMPSSQLTPRIVAVWPAIELQRSFISHEKLSPFLSGMTTMDDHSSRSRRGTMHPGEPGRRAMGLFDKKKKSKDDFDSPVEQIDLSAPSTASGSLPKDDDDYEEVVASSAPAAAAAKSSSPAAKAAQPAATAAPAAAAAAPA